MNAMLYSYLFPDDVAGLVLVDSSFIDEMDLFPEEFSEGILAFNILRFLSPLGVSRFGGFLEIMPMESGFPNNSIPSPLRDITKIHYYKHQFADTAYKELIYFSDTINQLKGKISKHNSTLTNLPTAIIASPEGKSRWQMYPTALHLKNFSILVAHKSDHYIPYFQPEIILDAIKIVQQKLNKT